MKNGLFRLCSMILVIVLLVNMLPLQVMAQQLNTGRIEQNPTESVTSEDDLSTNRIVEEIPQKRTEFSKEFLLENGLHMITVYPEAVHYATQNGWEEIDNTLIAKADGTITNTAGVWDVYFPQQLNKDKSISIQKDGYTLSFFMAGEIANSGNAMVKSVYAAEPEATEAVTIAGMKQSAAAIQTLDLTAMQVSAKHEQMVQQKAYSRLTYANVYDNTDVVYDLQSNKVKESIVLESYNSALQGYHYTLDVGTMIPVLEESGQIVFYDANRENIIFVMPAPYMIDDAGEYNDDIQVQLTGSGSRYTMTYLLPQQWLAAEDRVWPVILDPVVQPELTTENIRDRTVITNDSFSQTWGMNACGRYESGKYARTFLKYDNLPKLTSSDVVVGATVYMYKPNASSTITTVHAHKVLGTWASETITWDDQPNYDTTIEDYAIVDAVDWYGWDITDIVRGWYAGENTGVMFKASDEIETGSVANFKEFYSSDFGTEPSRPILSIIFRNNNGLESYWDYTSSSAGRAGTGYINNYTGNLIWVREDMGFGGNRMPVSINHVYNANDAYSVDDINNSKDSAGNGFGLGNGWRTNYNQLVYQWSTDSKYYVWEDSDGTDHYFYLETSGTYKDEDGLELTLTTTGSGTEKYQITDKNGNISYFDTRGRLSKIQNNQTTKSSITIAYDGTTNRISTITDGAGREYHFQYTSGLLSAISYVGHGATEIYCTTFDYENSNLVGIYENEADYTDLTYGTNNLLTSVTNSLGYSLSYIYTTMIAGKPARVASVTESHYDALGGQLTFDYAHNQTTVTDYHGNTLIYQFNNMGNTICVQDDEGHAQYYTFAINGSEELSETNDETIRANQLKVSSKLQNTAYNGFRDNSFEYGDRWLPINSLVSSTRSYEEAYHGSASLKMTRSSSGAESGISGGGFSVQPGETYTFSGYVKTGACSVYLIVTDGTASYTGDSLEAYQDWTRLQVVYTNTSSTEKWVSAQLMTTEAGVAYLDCVQGEQTATASRYNIIANGDFMSSALLYAWNKGSACTSDDTEVTGDCQVGPEWVRKCVKLVGSPTEQKRIYQDVCTSGSAGDSFVLSGWAKGDSAPLEAFDSRARQFGIIATFNYQDGDTSEHIVQFNPYVDGTVSWQYAAIPLVAEKAYSSITVELAYDYNVNTAYFDGVYLYKEEFGTSYTYDEEGNVVSVTDLQKQETTYEYTNNDLTRIVESNGNEMTYTYDDHHNVLTATSETGQVYNFVYDTYGNNTSVSTTVGGVTMSTSADYSTDGNLLESVTDALGKETTYGYDADTGLLEWVEYPEDTASTRTNYTYESLNLLDTVSAYTDTGKNMYASYYYNGDLVYAIDTYTSAYFINRGDFDLVNNVYAGEYNLAEYTYTDDRKYNLSRLDYGNNDRVEYTYDGKDRLTQETYEDGDTVTYAYNNDGELAIVTDSATGITTKYYYDLIGRLVKQEETGGNRSHSVQYTYDSLNNLESLKETINGTDHTSDYEYDTYNRVDSVTNGTVSENYTYDSFSRVQQSVTKNGNTNVLTESYTFTAPSANATSGQIATNRLQATGYDVTYSYTYDDNGNILSISDGTYTTSYVYDSANQLIRENNQAGGFTHTWEYDHGGNILNRKEYAYTIGALGTPTDTVIYTYDDEMLWGDLLYSYDGQNITFDGIGNTLYDGTWTYTWEHGRELAMMSNGAATWSFTYDANGMRTKRTNSGTTYQYIYNGSSLSQMTVNSNIALYFAYGANGVPMSVTYNNITYYYVTNLQGDVIAILNSAGSPVVHYTYDAWGNPISTTGSMASTLGAYNPLRYRGYVFDQETQLYYLQSRYYNPEWGRFLNADAFLSTGQGPLGNNMFAYCNNNPINKKDENGYLGVAALCLIGALAGGAIDYAAQVITNYRSGITGVNAWTNVNVGSIASSAFSGALSAIPGSGVVVALADSVGSVVIEHGVNSLISGSEIDFQQAGKDIITNLATDAVMPDFAEVEIPKYIRDIKEEAVEQGIKGTRKLQKYLDYRQVSGIFINSFNSHTSSMLVAHCI